MSSLIQQSPEAQIWVEAMIKKYEKLGAYERIVPAVVWSKSVGVDGNLILDVDPDQIVQMINSKSIPLIRNHDPGSPVGRVLEASRFDIIGSKCFVAAILGNYGQSGLLSFIECGINCEEISPLPDHLPSLEANFRIDVEADPREVDTTKLNEITEGLEVPVELTERSHNSADILQQLISIGVPYALLVWNPFVTTIAQEAGKDSYLKAKKSLSTILKRVGLLENPICEIQSYQSGCSVSFIIRGKGEKHHLQANASLSDAARKAHKLIENLKRNDRSPIKIVYEFNRDLETWVPSFAELADGRLMSDNLVLIAVEDLPKGMSLGLALKK